MFLIIVYEIGYDITRLIPLIPKHTINNYDPFEFIKSCRVRHVKYSNKIYFNELINKYRDRDQHILLIIEGPEPYQSLPYTLSRFADFMMIQEGEVIKVFNDCSDPPYTIPIP